MVCLCVVVCWLQLLCGVLLGTCFLPLWPSPRLLGTSLLGVFGSSLSDSGLVALVFATGLPAWLLWARLVFLASCLSLPRCGGSQASSFYLPLPVAPSGGRVLSNPVGFLPMALFFVLCCSWGFGCFCPVFPGVVWAFGIGASGSVGLALKLSRYHYSQCFGFRDKIVRFFELTCK